MQSLDFPQLKQLYELGFALHWLKPKSKVPLKSGWTKGERASWVALSKEYKKGLNVGVRLGAASKLSKGYLAVIDLDVKGKDESQRKEAQKKLFEIFPEAKNAPRVISGRGNGSAHYYVCLESPVSGSDKKAQSPELVKVKMPSVPPSEREKKELTPLEVKTGLRLRAAWEISLLSEGRQVVLPGSIHPDTGRAYVWGQEFEASKLPLLTGLNPISDASKTTPVKESVSRTMTFETVDLQSLGLKKEQLAEITTGEGVSDRSATAFGICMALATRKVSDEKILSILTDKKYYLGATGYDHAKTKDRRRAAYWIEKYCLEKAKSKVSESIFDQVIEIGGADWHKKLSMTTSKGQPPKIKVSFANIILILQNEIDLQLLKRNLFTHKETWGCDTPWGYKAGRERSSGNDDLIQVKSWLFENFGFDAPVNVIEEALLFITLQNTFHPVKDYLESLEWDGVPRVEKAFFTYLGSKMPKTYLRAVSRKFFLALIKRIYKPGCKFDHLPVLEGAQGVGKSTFGRILVSDEWFLDGLPDLADKDAALNIQGIWLCEMSELSVLYRSQLEAAKAFIVRQTDKVRPPYGRRRVDSPRSNVFLGTTNSEDYLSDVTGNRRFWPVKVARLEFQKLRDDRDQLLAEAKFLYDFASEPLYLDGRANVQALRIQESRRIEDESDAMQMALQKYLSISEADRAMDLKCFQLDQLFDEGPFQNLFQKNMANRKSAAIVLTRAGYKKIHTMKGKRWKHTK